jgi:hypothetical protein
MYYFPPGQSLPATTEPLVQKMAGLSDAELVEQINMNNQYAAERAKQAGIASTGVQGISADGKAILIFTTLNPDLDTK